MKLIQTLANEETGASMAEYAVMLAIIAVGVVSAVGLFRDQIVSIFNSSASGLANAQ
jgi:Flp pilus assembly pilin Flp